MSLKAPMKISPRKSPVATSYRVQQTLQWKIPVGEVYAGLILRNALAMTIGAQDCTALQTNGMQRAIRAVRLLVKFPGMQGLVFDVAPRGVNDGAAGRTASAAGQMLAAINLYDRGTPIPQTDPGLTQAAHAVRAAFPIMFDSPRDRWPERSALDLRGIPEGGAILEADIGILETTAAGDDTDVLVTDAASTVAVTGDWDLSGLVIKNPPDGQAYDLRKMQTYQEALAVRTALPVDIGVGKRLRRLFCMVKDDDVLSDARVTELKVLVDNFTAAADGYWGEFQDAAKARAGIETWLAGHNVIDFIGDDGIGDLNTLGAAKCLLQANVPAGAVVAADNLMVVSDEIVVHPQNLQKQVARAKGRKLGRR